MLAVVERVNRYVEQGRALFDQDELVQTWVLHHLQVLGEAASKLSPALRRQNPAFGSPLFA